jgi:hypothetical protein
MVRFDWRLRVPLRSHSSEGYPELVIRRAIRQRIIGDPTGLIGWPLFGPLIAATLAEESEPVRGRRSEGHEFL